MSTKALKVNQDDRELRFVQSNLQKRLNIDMSEKRMNTSNQHPSNGGMHNNNGRPQTARGRLSAHTTTGSSVSYDEIGRRPQTARLSKSTEVRSGAAAKWVSELTVETDSLENIDEGISAAAGLAAVKGIALDSSMMSNGSSPSPTKDMGESQSFRPSPPARSLRKQNRQSYESPNRSSRLKGKHGQPSAEETKFQQQIERIQTQNHIISQAQMSMIAHMQVLQEQLLASRRSRPQKSIWAAKTEKLSSEQLHVAHMQRMSSRALRMEKLGERARNDFGMSKQSTESVVSIVKKSSRGSTKDKKPRKLQREKANSAASPLTVLRNGKQQKKTDYENAGNSKQGTQKKLKSSSELNRNTIKSETEKAGSTPALQTRKPHKPRSPTRKAKKSARSSNVFERLSSNANRRLVATPSMVHSLVGEKGGPQTIAAKAAKARHRPVCSWGPQPSLSQTRGQGNSPAQRSPSRTSGAVQADSAFLQGIATIQEHVELGSFCSSSQMCLSVEACAPTSGLQWYEVDDFRETFDALSAAVRSLLPASVHIATNTPGLFQLGKNLTTPSEQLARNYGISFDKSRPRKGSFEVSFIWCDADDSLTGPSSNHVELFSYLKTRRMPAKPSVIIESLAELFNRNFHHLMPSSTKMQSPRASSSLSQSLFGPRSQSSTGMDPTDVGAREPRARSMTSTSTPNSGIEPFVTWKEAPAKITRPVSAGARPMQRAASTSQLVTSSNTQRRSAAASSNRPHLDVTLESPTAPRTRQAISYQDELHDVVQGVLSKTTDNISGYFE